MKKFFCIFLAVVFIIALIVASGCTPTPDNPSQPSQPIKLTTPTVSIDDNGLAKWNAVPNASEYAYQIGNGEEQRTDKRSITLEDRQSIAVKAVGDGEKYLDSEYSAAKLYKKPESIPDYTNPNLKPLATPFVSVNEIGIATWADVANAKKYEIKINNGESVIETYSCSHSLKDGETIQVKALGDGVTYGASAYSAAVKYNKTVKADGWYVLQNKTINGINVTSQYISNAIELKDGVVNWYELDMSGSNKIEGTYTLSGSTVRIRIGIKTYPFELTNEGIEFSGTVDRKELSYKFEKQTRHDSHDQGDVNFVDELFGDDISKNYYNYCPSIIVEGKTMHIWYCSNRDDALIVDYVAYRKGTLHDDGKWSFTDKTFALQASTSGWDKQHVCDPSVVKGDFSYNGEKYNYMMAYLGCVTTDNSKNEVGVAFAKNPEGPYVKYDKNPVADYYKDFNLSRTDSSQNQGVSGNTNWGYGQPSLINVDKAGKVILFYAKGTPKGTYTTAELWDMSNVNNAQLLDSVDLSETGITNAGGAKDCINNADFAYDPATKRLYCVKEDFPYPTDKGINWITGSNTIFYLQLNENETSVCNTIFDSDFRFSWNKVGVIDKALTGYVRNHNCGIVTDGYGWISTPSQLQVVYTMSLPYTDFPDWTIPYDWGVGQWPALHTYRLHGVTFDLVSTWE